MRALLDELELEVLDTVAVEVVGDFGGAVDDVGKLIDR
jgi:hypothetical protein